jgi:hypothetical protein
VSIKERDMTTSKISRSNICGKFFDAKRGLKKHIDKEHRITNTKIVDLRG